MRSNTFLLGRVGSMIKSEVWLRGVLDVPALYDFSKSAEIFSKIFSLSLTEDLSRPYEEAPSYSAEVLGVKVVLVGMPEGIEVENVYSLRVFPEDDLECVDKPKKLNISSFITAVVSSRSDLVEKIKTHIRLKASLHITQKFSLNETIEKLGSVLSLEFEKDLKGTSAFASYQAKALGLNISLLEAKDSYELSVFPDSDISFEDVSDDVDFSSYLMSVVSVKSDLEFM